MPSRSMAQACSETIKGLTLGAPFWAGSGRTAHVTNLDSTYLVKCASVECSFCNLAIRSTSSGDNRRSSSRGNEVKTQPMHSRPRASAILLTLVISWSSVRGSAISPTISWEGS
eukprot:Skav236256  [mRNA]  locus=scaffold829:491726:499998:+ [translate_table: standard]